MAFSNAHFGAGVGAIYLDGVAAEVVKGVFLHVHVAGLSTVTEVTMTMLELGVKVDLYV